MHAKDSTHMPAQQPISIIHRMTSALKVAKPTIFVFIASSSLASAFFSTDNSSSIYPNRQALSAMPVFPSNTAWAAAAARQVASYQYRINCHLPCSRLA